MKTILVSLFVLMLFSCSAALAQARDTAAGRSDASAQPLGDPIAPSTQPAVTPHITLRPTHKFFDRENSLAIGAVAVSLAGDAWSTQLALAYPGAREMNPLARPFVGSRPGEVAYSSAGFAMVVGALYLAHKTNHHRWERVAPLALAGWESFLAGWNLHQISLARASR